jgi:flagellar export protein FliJ
MAKRYQFRLAQVLSLRKQVEDIRVRELAQAKGQLLLIEDALKKHSEEEESFLDTYGNFEKTEGFNSDQIMAYCEYKDWLLRREKDLRRREKEWLEEVEHRRQATIKASRERQLLENLEKKQKRAHDQGVLGEEQRFLDEISSIAFVRRDRAQSAQKMELAETLRR